MSLKTNFISGNTTKKNSRCVPNSKDSPYMTKYPCREIKQKFLRIPLRFHQRSIGGAVTCRRSVSSLNCTTEHFIDAGQTQASKHETPAVARNMKRSRVRNFENINVESHANRRYSYPNNFVSAFFFLLQLPACQPAIISFLSSCWVPATIVTKKETSNDVVIIQVRQSGLRKQAVRLEVIQKFGRSVIDHFA